MSLDLYLPCPISNIPSHEESGATTWIHLLIPAFHAGGPLLCLPWNVHIVILMLQTDFLIQEGVMNLGKKPQVHVQLAFTEPPG